MRNLKMSSVTAVLLLTFLSLPAHATDIKYSYDSLNRLISADYSNGIIVQYTYDEVGNRLTKDTAQSPDTDADGHFDNWDNCASASNPTQADTYPPDGNEIGDACDCEGNFTCDADVDGSDASTFKTDFGRSTILHPCIAGDTCNGDFSCDGDVDGSDASLFKQDFGRSSIQNTCPACVAVVEWCSY